MRQQIIFLLLILAGAEAFAQRQPIRPYNENGYTVAQMKEFALESTELSSNWRKAMLGLINAGLKSAGYNLVLQEDQIAEIFDKYVIDSAVVLVGFINSGRVGNQIQFFSDENFKGGVGVFVYGKCRVILYKNICGNLLKVSANSFSQTKPVLPVQKPAPIPAPIPEPKNPTGGGEPSRIDTVVQTIYLHDTVYLSDPTQASTQPSVQDIDQNQYQEQQQVAPESIYRQPLPSARGFYRANSGVIAHRQRCW